MSPSVWSVDATSKRASLAWIDLIPTLQQSQGFGLALREEEETDGRSTICVGCGTAYWSLRQLRRPRWRWSVLTRPTWKTSTKAVPHARDRLFSRRVVSTSTRGLLNAPRQAHPRSTDCRGRTGPVPAAAHRQFLIGGVCRRHGVRDISRTASIIHCRPRHRVRRPQTDLARQHRSEAPGVDHRRELSGQDVERTWPRTQVAMVGTGAGGDPQKASRLLLQDVLARRSSWSLESLSRHR